MIYFVDNDEQNNKNENAVTEDDTILNKIDDDEPSMEKPASINALTQTDPELLRGSLKGTYYI